MVPAEGVELGDVGQFAEGAVGLGGVEGEAAAIADGADDEPRQVADGDLVARADVDVAVADVGIGALQISEVDMLHDVDAGVGHLLAPEELAQRCARAPERDGVGGDAVLGEQGEQLLVRGRAGVDVLNGAADEVGADVVHAALVEAAGQVDLADHGGQDVAALQVEVVVRAVEVGGHDGDVVRAVLQVEALAHLQAGDLGDGVGLVGVLQRGGQEGVLAHGLGHVAGVDAGAAEEEQFADIVAEALADDVLLDAEVAVDEVGAVAAVGHDPTHVGRGQDDVRRALLVEESANGSGVQQVELRVGTAHEVRVPLGEEVVPNGRPDESAVAGDIDFGLLIHHRFTPPLGRADRACA